MTDTLSLRIASLGDEEIVRILTVDAEQYRPEALDVARAEATRRKLSLDAGAPAPEPTDRSLGRAVRAFGQGVASQLGPAAFTAAEKVVSCPHCGGQSFEERQAVVNTRGLTFFGLDWLDKGVTVLSCTRCGLLQWFRIAPARAPR
ncbi:MAG: zinc ribbon domain-containing protein [Thermoanaerobaculia bacterium]